jgi:hypothetical protein
VTTMVILTLLIGCDADPDRPRYGAPRYDSRHPLQWSGLRQGLPRCADILEGIAQTHGMRPKVTWCVRSDLQVGELHGDPAWSYIEFESLWRSLEDAGDEIGWHPHLWRWSDTAQCWHQEIEDEAWIEDCLVTGHRALCDRTRARVVSARGGWEFHNNTTMRTLAALGVAADFSASPGRQTAPDSESEGSSFDRYMDWTITPDEPYQPSCADYRRPARDGEGSLEIWEIPRSVYVPRTLRFAAQTWARASRLCRGRFREAVGRQVGRNVLHAPGIAMAPRFFGGLTRRKIEEAKRVGHALLVTSFHADELLERTGSGKARFYAPGHLRRNLEVLIETAAREGVQLEVATVREWLQSNGVSK